jgi:NAD(P)-dependent dehydrogenase (short-subunit alcohol dehydrogenase family)
MTILRRIMGSGACSRRHALVTGASTGIGRATALRLAREGYHVFATVCRESDGADLARAAAGRLAPLQVDVRSADQIAKAAQVLGEHVAGRGLDVLVNNAGYGVVAPLEGVSMDAFRDQLDVNVSGQLAVTQAFLPMLRRARGRIVMIGSLAGRVTMPFAGPQAASKRAVVALADALRLELSKWQVKVVLVEPASIRTDAVEKLRRDTSNIMDGLDARIRGEYGPSLSAAIRRALRLERHGSDPGAVADLVLRAVSTGRPRARYVVGRHSHRLSAMAVLPPVLLDPLRRWMFGLSDPVSHGGVRPAGGTRAG